jgi:competence protein ComGC
MEITLNFCKPDKQSIILFILSVCLLLEVYDIYRPSNTVKQIEKEGLETAMELVEDTAPDSDPFLDNEK